MCSLELFARFLQQMYSGPCKIHVQTFEMEVELQDICRTSLNTVLKNSSNKYIQRKNVIKPDLVSRASHMFSIAIFSCVSGPLLGRTQKL